MIIHNSLLVFISDDLAQTAKSTRKKWSSWSQIASLV